MKTSQDQARVTLASARTLRLALLGAVLALGAGAFGVAQAQEGGHARQGMKPMHGHHAMGADAGIGMMGMPGRQMERMLDKIGATPEQRTQLRQIHESARADMRQQREQAAPLREQARALWTQPTVDARAAEALRQQMQAQRELASKRQLQAMLDASRVLTPAQRQQMAEMAQARAAKRQEMMQRRAGEARSAR